MNDVKGVELLTFILVKALYLNVEYGVFVDLNVLGREKVFFKLPLFYIFDFQKLVEYFGVFSESQQLFKLRSVFFVPVAYK